MQLCIEVLGPEIPVFVAESIFESIHARRAQNLMGEFMHGRTSNATTNGVDERIAI